MNRSALGATLIVTLTFAAPAAGSGYPTPPAKNLAKPFTGEPVAAAWLGKWRVTGGVGNGVVWQLFAQRSAACKTLVAGRTTCFVMRAPGHEAIWAGAITLHKSKVVFRMTYKPWANALGCFSDDPYNYRISKTQLLIYKGTTHSCFWEPTEHFPQVLIRIR